MLHISLYLLLHIEKWAIDVYAERLWKCSQVASRLNSLGIKHEHELML